MPTPLELLDQHIVATPDQGAAPQAVPTAEARPLDLLDHLLRPRPAAPSDPNQPQMRDWPLGERIAARTGAYAKAIPVGTARGSLWLARGVDELARMTGVADEGAVENIENLQRDLERWAGPRLDPGQIGDLGGVIPVPSAEGVAQATEVGGQLAGAVVAPYAAIPAMGAAAAGNRYRDVQEATGDTAMAGWLAAGDAALNTLPFRLGRVLGPEMRGAERALGPVLGQRGAGAAVDAGEAAALAGVLGLGDAGLSMPYDQERADAAAEAAPGLAGGMGILGGLASLLARGRGHQRPQQGAEKPAEVLDVRSEPGAPAAPPVDPSALTQEVDVEQLARWLEQEGQEASGRTVDPRDLEVVRSEMELRDRLLGEHRQMEDQALDGAVLHEQTVAEAARREAEAPETPTQPADPTLEAEPPTEAGPGVEKARHARGMEAARAIDEQLQVELQEIYARRSAGEIGKAQAAALKREAQARRLVRMTEAMEAIAGGREPLPLERPAPRGDDPAAAAIAGERATDPVPPASEAPRATDPTAPAPAAGAPRPVLEGVAPAPAPGAQLRSGRPAAETGLAAGRRPAEVPPAELTPEAPFREEVDQLHVEDLKQVKGPRGHVRVRMERVGDDQPMFHVYDENGGREPIFSSPDRKDAVTWAHNHVKPVGTRKHPYDGGFQYSRDDGAPARAADEPAGGEAPPLRDLDSRIMPSSEALHFEPLARQWRKATGDRTPVEGSEGWQRLQRQAREAERARRGEPDQRQVPSDRIAKPAAPPAESSPAKPAAPAQDTPQHMVGRRAGRIDVSPLPGGTGKKTGQILLDVGKSLGKRVWQGKTAPGAGGTYFPGTAKTLIRYHEDLDVAAHELAHALDDHYGIVGRWVQDPTSPFDAELKPFWQSPASSAAATGPRGTPAYRRAEGVAEWVRAWLVNPAAAEKAAPQFHAYVQQHLPPKAMAALRAFGDDIRRFAGMSATDQSLAHISTAGDAGPGLVDRVKGELRRDGYPFRTTALDRLKAQLLDVLAPVMRAATSAAEMTGRKLLPAEDPRVLMRLMGGINDKVQDVFDHGMVAAKLVEGDGAGGVRAVRADGVGGGIDWLVEPAKDAKDIDRLGAYMVAQRVLEKARQIDEDLSGRFDALRAMAAAKRKKQLEALGRLAKRMRARAETRAKSASQALERGRKSQDLADRQGDAADRDLAGLADEVFERQQQRLARMLSRLQARSHGAEAARVERRIAALRARADKRRRRLDQELQRAVDAGEKVKTTNRRDVEADIAAMKERIDRAYLAAQHRIDRRFVRALMMAEHQKGRLSGVGGGIFSDHERAAKVLQEVAGDADLKQRLDEMASRYRTWADAVLRYQVDTGRISAETYDQVKARNEYYVAMHREENEDLAQIIGGRGRGKQLGSVAQTVQRFTGSTKAIKNPIENLLEQTARSIQEADRNAAMRSFVDLLDAKRGMYQGRPADLAAIGHQVPEATPGAIAVYRDGRLEHWQFEEGVFEAFKGWADVMPRNVIDSFFRGLKDVLHTGITRFPAFLVRNAFRDSVDRAILTQSGSQAWDVFKGSSDGMKEAQTVAGGSLAGHFLRDRATYQAQMRRKVRELEGRDDTIVALPGKVWRGWARLAESSEMRNRQAEFRRAFAKARSEGLDELNATLRAAAEARGLIDFAVAGNTVRFVNRYVPFVNARVQGVARMARGIRDNPGGVAMRWALNAVMPSLGVYAYNVASGNEEEYLDLDAKQRDHFWNLKIADNLWLAVPKPFEFGVMATGVERALNAARGKSYGGEAGDYLADVLESVSPLGVGELSGPLKPFVEAVANHSFFTKRPIVPTYEAKEPVDQREGTAHASRIGQLGQFATGNQVDARIIDHVLKGMLGSTGTSLLKISDIGREDRTGQGAEAAMHAAGLFHRSPGPEAASVQQFREDEVEVGRGDARPTRRLQGLQREYFQAKGAAGKEVSARELRAYAKGEDPLRDFDRATADATRARTEFRKLRAQAEASKAPADLKAMNAFQTAHAAELARADFLEQASREIARLDKLRAAAAEPKQAEVLEKRMRAVAAKAMAPGAK